LIERVIAGFDLEVEVPARLEEFIAAGVCVRGCRADEQRRGETQRERCYRYDFHVCGCSPA
jgi:hypothetical protein